MVPTCSFVYASGKTCGRIPRRGESLCPDHRRLAAGSSQEAFEEEMNREVHRLAVLPLDEVLLDAEENLGIVQMWLEKKAPPRLHARFIKATIAIVTALDCVIDQRQILAQLLPGVPPDRLEALIRLLWRGLPQGPSAAPPAAAREA